jgi:F-type H+-transporting ATPase subunit a
VENRRIWKWGVNRWLVLAFIVLGAVAASAYPPVRPEILLPAEPLTGPLFALPGIGEFRLTNTFVALIFADILLLLLAVSVRRSVTRERAHALRGITGVVEALLEYLYNLTESTAGKWAGRIFPWVGTIVLLVLVGNWMELIPGVDSLGLLHHAEAEGHPVQELFRVGMLPVVTILGAPAASGGEEGFVLVPFVRAVATDLNFPLALALVSVVMTQVYGVRAQGAAYFTKFFNTGTLFRKPFFGAIDFGVGLLELVSEISKIISFTFRLFGNIFAGSVLLFVIGSLVPVFAQTMFLLLEFFVGMIQAIVFGMLTLVFMAQAVAGHGHGAEEPAHAASSS